MTVASRGLDASFVAPWSSLKSSAHITWGACKATEGLTFTDDSFATNWDRLKKAGLVRLAYHFAHPESSASGQVDHFLRVVRPVAGDVLVCDLERGTTQAATNGWTRTFLTGLRETGCAVGLYMGVGYAGTATGHGLSDFADFWWTARYPGLSTWPTSVNPQLEGNTTGWAAPHIWQWSQSYLGKYDANVSTLTAEQIATPGGDMPLSSTDLDALAHAVWAYDQGGTKGQAWAYIQQAANAAAAARDAIPGIAAAVVDALPAPATGGLSKADVEAALVTVLQNGVAGAAS